MKAKDFYKSVCEDLSKLGIFLDREDVHYLVYIILKNLKESCRGTKKLYLARNKEIQARMVGEEVKVYLNDEYEPKNKRIRMSDRVSNRIFENIFLPSMISLLESEED